MNALVLGAGLMGKAIVYDLVHKTTFSTIKILDGNKKCLNETKHFFQNESKITFHHQDVTDSKQMKSFLNDADVVISAVPYLYNESLTKQAIKNKCHFIDLGGNNKVVTNQKKLHSLAEKAEVTIIPDSGLAPGLVSILTKSLVEEYGHLSKLMLRVGGLPQLPQEPWKYQLVFSANGLINEYVEDAIVLDHGRIKSISSLTQEESIDFPKPFGRLEAFTTSGGCSTLPYTYKSKIDYLDYKTIRYQGHLQQIKPLFNLGLHSQDTIKINNIKLKPRDILIHLLEKSLPSEGKDVVLLKVTGEQETKKKKRKIEFEMIDYYDEETNLSAMMRTTGFPVSITADLIASNHITKNGVFTPEEIIPVNLFLKEEAKTNIDIEKKQETIEQ